MTTRHLVSLVTGVLIFSILLPICLSVWLAHRQAEDKFVDDLNRYASRVLIRANLVTEQAKTALTLTERYQGTPCSRAHLLAMRRVAFSLRYVQEVLYVVDRKPVCSSLELNSLSPAFPPPMRMTPDGYDAWLTKQNDLGIDRFMAALGNQNHVVMIDPESLIDVIPFGALPMDTALIGNDSNIVFAQSAALDPNVLKQLQRQNYAPLQYHGAMYVVKEVPELRFTIIAWTSLKPLKEDWYQQLVFWLPFGILFSLAAATFMVRILKRLQSSRNRLLDAIRARAFVVHYQPIVALSSGKIVGAEALVRWPQPDGSLLSPDVFIPLAEQSGLTSQLTKVVVEKVFDDLGEWLKHHPELHISVNIAPEDLISNELPRLLSRLLNHAQLQPQQIALELTERGFADPKISAPAIAAYRLSGHAVYIDDFGTGYSSLSYLQDLDVDILKLDKSFVDALEFKHVTPHIIEMAKSLKLAMVAEGIETEGQLEWLRRHGVQYGQGWLYSKALPKLEFIQWAENNLDPE